MSGIQRTVFPITSDYYNIQTNGKVAIGNNRNGSIISNLAMDVCGNFNTIGTYYSYSDSSYQTCVQLPADTSANRPLLTGNSYKGFIRYNTDTDYLEFYNGSVWQTLLSGNPALTLQDSGGNNTYYNFIGNASTTLSTYGYYTITPNIGMTIKFQLWGAGGAGAAGNNTPTNGAAGGYVEGTLSLTSNTSYTLLVGQGGLKSMQYVGAGSSIYNTGSAFPDGGNCASYQGYGQGGGGGSTRLGPLLSNSSASYNNTSVTYYLIAGGGAGGTDYSTSGTPAGYGGVSPNGNGVAGGTYYASGEATTSLGGGGTQSAGGAAGTTGRTLSQSPPVAGAKYSGGQGGGGGGGGGYYGGGGSCGYYAQSGGGSSYIGAVTGGQYGTYSGTYNISPAAVSGTAKPTNVGNGGAAGGITGNPQTNNANGYNGAIIFTFISIP